MKHRSAALLFALAAFAGLPAYAAPVVMLQFGSFENREEATARLNEMKSKHAGVLGTVSASIREVNLPPDNLTVYRTQAGPIENRAQAQNMCAQLASNGDECYVVETAMLPPAAPVAASVPMPAPTSGALAPRMGNATVAPLPVIAAAPLPNPSFRAIAPDNTSLDTGASVTLPSVNELRRTSGPALAPLRSDEMAAPADDAVTELTPAPPSPQMQAALDRAEAQQNTAIQTGSDAKPLGTPRGSFWSRMNPFAEDEEVAAPVSVRAEPVSAPAPTVLVTAPLKPVSSAVLPAPVIRSLPGIPPAAPEKFTSTVIERKPAVTFALPSSGQSAQLPPPPPPVRTAMDAPTEIAPPPAVMAAPAPKPEIVLSVQAPAQPPVPALLPPKPTTPPPPQYIPPNSPPVLPPPPAPVADARGSVNVEEAKRVPLSETMVPPPPPVASVPGPAVIPPPSAALLPSATLGQKTLWAQIGMFGDTQSALAFWDRYRQAHPDFPVVRVRVTSPLMGKMRGNDQVSLRVGPFAKPGFINNLCASMPADMSQIGLNCSQVTDMGIASGGNRIPGFLPGSRYAR